MKKIFLSQLIAIFCTFTQAQFYNTGSDPASVRWSQIKTDKFQIIFPNEANTDAQRIANTLTLTTTHTASGISSNIKKPIKIVFHNQNILSNGYVVWAPRRMELITTMPQRSYAQNYIDQLALHEYRHVAQVEKLNQGFTRGLSFLMGEIAPGAVTGILPLWFLEGDAVVNETALSSTGRGREPSFNQGLKAIELEKSRRLTYDQIYLGTYRTAAPNHYEFGYQMVAYAQVKYGNTFWGNTLDLVGKRPFTFIPFYSGLKKQANLSKTKLYNETFDFMGAKWKEEASKIIPHTATQIQTEYKSKFVSYRFPYQQTDGSVIALRSSIDDINKFVHLKNGKEKVLKVVGSFSGSQIAYSDKYIAWEETRYDPRWEQRNYSVIKIYNQQNKKTRILKRTERHFSPSINPAEDKIAVQKVNPVNRSTIEIYDIESSLLIKDFEHPEGLLLTYNCWINDSSIAIVTVSEKGKAIYVLDWLQNKWTKIFGESFNNISNLYAKNNIIYFTYTQDGRQNIYQLELTSGEVLRVTNTKTGVDFATVSQQNKQMIFSEYGSEGYKLKKLEMDNNQATNLSDIPQYEHIHANYLSSQSKINIQDTIYETKKFESSKYSKSKNTFNFHSWILPVYVDLDEITSDVTLFTNNVHPGVMLFSQNSLSTVTSTFGYYYKDGYSYFNPSFKIKAFYPVLSFDMKIGGPPEIIQVYSEVTNVSNSLKNHQQYNLRISLPFKLSNGIINSGFTSGIQFAYENTYFVDSNLSNINDVYDYYEGIYYYEGKSYTDFTLSYYLTSKSSYKDINPKWGISTYYSYYNPLKNGEYYDNNQVFLSNIYLPGILKTHSIVVNLAIENGRGARFSPPRGFLSSELYPRKSAIKYGLNYTLPLLYPDLSIGPVVYIKRIHTNIFYDRMDYNADFYSGGVHYVGDLSLESTGIELGFETNFMRFFFPITPTVRYSYRLPNNDSRFSFFVTTNFNF